MTLGVENVTLGVENVTLGKVCHHVICLGGWGSGVVDLSDVGKKRHHVRCHHVICLGGLALLVDLSDVGKKRHHVRCHHVICFASPSPAYH